MKKTEFLKHIIFYIAVLFIVFSVVYLNLDYMVAIGLLFLVVLVDIVLVRMRLKRDTYSPLLARLLYLAFGLIPSFIDIGNLFLYYGIVVILIIGIEYYFNVYKFESNITA